MIEITIRKHPLADHHRDDLAYWLSRTPEARLAAVEQLRRQCYGDTGRLSRVARVIRRA